MCTPCNTLLPSGSFPLGEVKSKALGVQHMQQMKFHATETTLVWDRFDQITAPTNQLGEARWQLLPPVGVTDRAPLLATTGASLA